MTTSRKLCFLSFILTALTILGANCDIQFQYDTEQCLGQHVEYQCTVTGSSLLEWIVVVNGTSTILASYSSTPGNLAPSTATVGGGEFTVERLGNSPIISNISFTVQSSINGYTIQCIGGGQTEQFNISIAGPPPPPTDFEQKKSCDLVNISWTLPTFSSNCVSITNYNVTYNFSNMFTITEGRSVSILLDKLSPNTYCVRVATMDTANRTGEPSEDQCFKVKEIPPPPPPTNLMWDSDSHIFSWTPPELSSECVSIAYYNVAHNFSSMISSTTTNDTSLSLDELCPGSYCVTVAAVVTDKKMGNYSEEECFEVQEIPLPPPPAVPTLEYIFCNQAKINWTSSTVSTSQCIFVAGYSVMHNLNGSTTTIFSDNTNITISIDEYTLSRYCISVAAVDTDNRTGDYSKQECFELNDPMCNCSFDVTERIFSNVLEFTVMWNITNYYLPLVESVLNYNINGTDMGSSLIDQTGTFTTEIEKGSDQVSYMANVQVSNCIGSASCSCKNNASENDNKDTNVPIEVIVGVTVGFICLILLVVIMILLGIMFWKRAEKLHRNSKVKSNSKSAVTRFDEQSPAPNKK